MRASHRDSPPLNCPVDHWGPTWKGTRMKLAWLSVAAVLGGVAPAAADGGAPGADPDGGADFRPRPMRKDIVITVDGDRTPQNLALVAGIATAGALLSGLAVYYNLDSRGAAESVSPK